MVGAGRGDGDLDGGLLQAVEGKGKARALQEASLALMKARREKNGAAHPFYWGAFVSVREP